MLKEKLTRGKAAASLVFFTFIFAIPLIILGSYLFYIRHVRMNDPAYTIRAIVQTGPEFEALKSVYLAELMGLSADSPENVYAFDVKKAEKALLDSPVIKRAVVKRLPPNAIYVDYSVRRPVALLYDYQNAAIDDEGYIFPLYPFFTPKRLPEVYLGLSLFGAEEELSEGRWNALIPGEEMRLALSLLSLLSSKEYQSQFRLLRVDVSNAYADSYGQRQIILILEDQMREEKERVITYLFPRILRLSTDCYAQELQNYSKLREELASRSLAELSISHASTVKLPGIIIDLRIPQLGFIKR